MGDKALKITGTSASRYIKASLEEGEERKRRTRKKKKKRKRKMGRTGEIISEEEEEGVGRNCHNGCRFLCSNNALSSFILTNLGKLVCSY